MCGVSFADTYMATAQMARTHSYSFSKNEWQKKQIYSEKRKHGKKKKNCGKIST